MPEYSSLAYARSASPDYDEEFFDDMLRMFTDMGRGEVSKYMYDRGEDTADNNLWEEIVKVRTDYYVPQADSELMDEARGELARYVPSGVPYVDFGVGGSESFKRYVLPTMRSLASSEYFGLDFDQKILDQIESDRTTLSDIDVHTVRTDFFTPSNRIIAPTPALGVMNGITLTNMYGSLNDASPAANLVGALKYLSQLTNHGWLLLSIDTNQDRESLLKMYLTPLNSKLNIAPLPRMELDLPVRGFDASLFEYTPEWFPEKQLLVHLATASEDQEFMLGDYSIQVREGQKLHLFNSYKFRQSFFEECCCKASVGVVRSWKHQSGVMLYLLNDTRRVF